MIHKIDRPELEEAVISRLEEYIPKLAKGASQQAYLQALTTCGSVVEAVAGELVETSADGTTKVLRMLSGKSVPTQPGTRRVRKCNS